jgi:hypothetical protein
MQARGICLLALALTLIMPVFARAEAPPGPRLAFVRLIDSRSHPPSLDLLSAGPTGAAPELLTGTSRRGGIAPLEGLSWSPDGQTLAVGTVTGTDFAHVLDNDELDLFLAAADGSGLRQLTALPDTPGEISDDAVAPLFSADGKTVFFARVHNLLHSSIWAIGSDGGGLRQLTPDHAGRGFLFDIPGSVFPAGGELAFTRVKCTRKAGCQSSVRSLSLATGAERLIAKRATDPAYSPDGRRIALGSYRGHPRRLNPNELLPVTDLYVLDTASGTLQRMTRTRRVSEGHPSWDPWSADRFLPGSLDLPRVPGGIRFRDPGPPASDQRRPILRDADVCEGSPA